MQTPFSFDFITSFGLLSVFILSGLILRAKIRFFQKYLIPSSLIGGFAGLLILNTFPLTLNIEMFETITYHLFSVSFISVGLTAFAGAVPSGSHPPSRVGRHCGTAQARPPASLTFGTPTATIS